MFIIFVQIFTTNLSLYFKTNRYKYTDITAIKYCISLPFLILQHCLIIYLEYHKKVYASMLYSVTVTVLDTRSGAKEAMAQLHFCVRILVLLLLDVFISLKESIGNEVDQQRQEVNEIVSEYITGIISSLRLISKRYS